uniref:Uncharacterized protein n=1 Tax=Moniliophthora roreri TaxID=221103 RepID=A0A0W0G4N6_MONRR
MALVPILAFNFTRSVNEDNAAAKEETIKERLERAQKEEIEWLQKEFNSTQFYNFIDSKLTSTKEEAEKKALKKLEKAHITNSTNCKKQYRTAKKFFILVLQNNSKVYKPNSWVKIFSDNTASCIPDWQKTITDAMHFQSVA